MCGVIATFNIKVDVNKAFDLIRHRGPDSQSFCTYKNVNLIHSRLSIQDIKNGAQPYSIGNFTIVFNGEIYNHIELRKKLNKYTCVTNCDTETFLALFIEYGIEAIKHCDGMFAFVILDRGSNKLYFARDRSGKKPLYMFNNNYLMLASELNVFKSLIKDIEIDRDSINSYLRNGFFYKSFTPYKHVVGLNPGYLYSFDLGSHSITAKQYFDYLQFYKHSKIVDHSIALNKIDLCLHKSVRDRLLSSDLEVGTFLSGGIDSSLIVAVASKYVDKLRTFTMKFDGSCDESSLARLTAKKYDTNHTELSVSMNLRDEIEGILLNYGEPFMDSSAVPSYYVSKEAKKYVDVVLNGDGADEIFGGYRRYVPVANNWINIASALSKLLTFLPNPVNKRTAYDFFYRLLSISEKKGVEYYNSLTNNIFEDMYHFDNNIVFQEMREFILQTDSEDISNLSKALYMDFNMILTSDLLKKMDIATMSNSLESRSPFLSKYMLELAPTLDDRLKVKGFTTKSILRDLSMKYIDKTLVKLPKKGFEVPLRQWINVDLKENIYDSLNSGCFSREFIEWDFIKGVLNDKKNISSEKRSKILWTVYCLEVWLKNQKNV